MIEKKGGNNNNLVNKWAECDHFRKPLINQCLTFSHIMKQNANTASEGMKVYKNSDRAKAKTKPKRFFTFRNPPKNNHNNVEIFLRALYDFMLRNSAKIELQT